VVFRRADGGKHLLVPYSFWHYGFNGDNRPSAVRGAIPSCMSRCACLVCTEA